MTDVGYILGVSKNEISQYLFAQELAPKCLPTGRCPGLLPCTLTRSIISPQGTLLHV